MKHLRLKISAFYFFYFAAVGVYIIFLPKVLLDIGYTPTSIGIVFALAPLMRFLTPFLFLKHIKLDQKLFKLTLFFSVSSSFLFYFTIDNFYMFMFNNAILGMCLSLLLPYIELIAIKELKNRYGKSRLYGSIGFMVVGLVLANYLKDPYVALDYYFISTLFTALFAYLLLKYDEQEEFSNIEDDRFSLLQHWAFWLSLFLMQVSFGSFYNFFTIYETSHGLSYEIVSYLWTFGVLCEIVMLYFQTPLMRGNLLFLIKISTFSASLRWLLLYFYPNSLLIAYFTQSLHAFSFALYYSATIAYLFHIYENKKLAQQFFGGISFGLGGFVGSILAGIFYGEYLFLYASFVAFIAFLIIYNLE